MTNLVCRINQTDATQRYSGYSGFSGYPADYITIDLAADRLIWTAGSAEVYNHCGYSPSAAQLNIAATLIQLTDVEVAYCFLDDVSSAEKLHQVIGADSGDDQFVFCFSFDAATATEPTLEAWDTNAHATTALQVLGAGTPANSMIHAVCTTAASPGASWAGTNLAGANTVLLNDGTGAIVGAADLYANIYVKVPASYPTPEIATPVLTIRYTYS